MEPDGNLALEKFVVCEGYLQRAGEGTVKMTHQLELNLQQRIHDSHAFSGEASPGRMEHEIE